MTNFSNTSGDSQEIEWVDTNIYMIYFVLQVILCLANEYLMYLHIKMLKRQDLFYEKLLGCYGKFNIVCGAIIVVFGDGVIGLSPVSTIFDDWYCGIILFLTMFFVYFNNGFSLILACMIYVGSVHEAKVNYHGKEFVINLFCILSFVIPLISSLIALPVYMFNGMGHFTLLIDKCYGPPNYKNYALCYFDEDILHQEYGEWSDSVTSCLQFMCAITNALEPTFFSNILEGIFYWLIYSHIKW